MEPVGRPGGEEELARPKANKLQGVGVREESGLGQISVIPLM